MFTERRAERRETRERVARMFMHVGEKREGGAERREKRKRAARLLMHVAGLDRTPNVKLGSLCPCCSVLFG